MEFMWRLSVNLHNLLRINEIRPPRCADMEVGRCLRRILTGGAEIQAVVIVKIDPSFFLALARTDGDLASLPSTPSYNLGRSRDPPMDQLDGGPAMWIVAACRKPVAAGHSHFSRNDRDVPGDPPA
jgi:hypothetical protein